LGRGDPPPQKRKALGLLTTMSLAVFRCPTRSPWDGPPHNPVAAPFNAEFMPSVGRCDYAINEGDTFVGGDQGPRTLEEGDDPTYPWIDKSRSTGVSFLRSLITAANIRDGLGHTYLAGEKYRTLDSSDDLGYDQSMFSGEDLDINRWTAEPPIRDGTNLRASFLGGSTRFGSSHPRSCNFVFCDGSVRAAPFEIDPEVHRRLGTRAEMSYVDLSSLH
jgi:prepilin-type processing-associated H-X9-DG protein